jgi:hypothetical protein
LIAVFVHKLTKIRPLQKEERTIGNHSENKITDYFQSFIGQPAWDVTLGEGSFLTLKFGEALPVDNKSHKSHGTGHLWVYCCAWRIETPDDVLAYSEDDRSRLASIVHVLNGKSLESVEINFPHGDTLLHFSGRLILRLIPIHSENYEHWMLYTPEGVLVFGPGTNWQFETTIVPPQ